MTRRTLAVNGGLAVLLVAAATWGVLSVGDPSSASAATTRTATVSRGTVTAAVSASGNLSSTSSVGVDFAGSGGTVTAISVKVGQRVVVGQRLASIDDSSARRSLSTAQASLSSAKAQLATTTQGQSSQDQARDDAQVRSAEVTVSNARLSVTQAKASQSLDTSQQNALVAAAQTALNNAVGATAEASAQSALTQAKNTRANTLLKDGQQVRTQEGQVTAALAALSSQRASAAADAQPARPGAVASAQAQVKSAQVQVAGAQATLDETVLRAPVAGTVSSVSGVVGEDSSATASSSAATSSTSSSSSSSSGTTGFVVISGLSELQVTTEVAEADAAKVKDGQQATVTFSATGATAHGKVTNVDLQSTVSNNVVQYGVTVTLTEAPTDVRLGQTSAVSIVTGSKSGVLSAPSSAITTVAGVSTVTVKTGTKTATKVVQTGLVGDSSTEIVSGLSEGDVLVLPTASAGGTGFTFPGGGLGGGLGG